MKIYKISRKDGWDYDEFDSAIVIAKDSDDARKIHPWGQEYEITDNDCSLTAGSTRAFTDAWCSSDQVEVAYIGEAKPGSKRGVILASFNAG